jgi:hypothetical protein
LTCPQPRRKSNLDTIGRIRGLNQAFLDRIAPQRFVFHHVPKCGGTSVARALRKRYLTSQTTVKPEPSFRAFQAFTGRDDTERMLLDVNDLRKQMMLYLLYDDIRCISLHVPFSGIAYENFHDRYKFITILREPVSRFLSHYNWSSRKIDAHAQIDMDFDSFLGSERALRLGAEIVETFADVPTHADTRSPDAIARAVSNLNRMDIVGRLDDLAGFGAALKRELGIRIKIGHENKGPKSGGGVSYRDLNGPQKRQLEDICAPDIAVWRALFGNG